MTTVQIRSSHTPTPRRPRSRTSYQHRLAVAQAGALASDLPFPQTGPWRCVRCLRGGEEWGRLARSSGIVGMVLGAGAEAGGPHRGQWGHLGRPSGRVGHHSLLRRGRNRGRALMCCPVLGPRRRSSRSGQDGAGRVGGDAGPGRCFAGTAGRTGVPYGRGRDARSAGFQGKRIRTRAARPWCVRRARGNGR
jgi:hypothetical protein